MGKFKGILIFSLLSIIIFSSCAIFYPSIKKSRNYYLTAETLTVKGEKIKKYNEIISLLKGKALNGFKNQDVYIFYINSLYQMALLQPQKSQYYYQKATLAASIYVKMYPNSPFSHYFFAKSLYLTNNNSEKNIKKIISHSQKALKMMKSKKFAYERKELNSILQDINAFNNP